MGGVFHSPRLLSGVVEAEGVKGAEAGPLTWVSQRLR